MSLIYKRIVQIVLIGTIVVACKKKESEDPLPPSNQPAPNPEDGIFYQSYTVAPPPAAGFSDTIFYDVNKDNIPDISAFRQTVSLPDGRIGVSASLRSLNDTMYFTFSRTDQNRRMINTTDTILRSDKFEWQARVDYANFFWEPFFTPYFGFQYKNTNPNFGWFHYSAGRLKEIGFNRKVNASIRVGQKE